jgi:hypothetical protein
MIPTATPLGSNSWSSASGLPPRTEPAVIARGPSSQTSIPRSRRVNRDEACAARSGAAVALLAGGTGGLDRTTKSSRSCLRARSPCPPTWPTRGRSRRRPSRAEAELGAINGSNDLRSSAAGSRSLRGTGAARPLLGDLAILETEEVRSHRAALIVVRELDEPVGRDVVALSPESPTQIRPELCCERPGGVNCVVCDV